VSGFTRGAALSRYVLHEAAQTGQTMLEFLASPSAGDATETRFSLEEKMPDPTLSTAQITFETTDDDKRKESILDIRVVDKDDNIVARASSAYGLFDNNTTNGPFGLNVLDQVKKSKLKPGGNVTITWTPWSGGLGNHDEWHFNMFLDLVFSDNEHVVVDENSLILSYNQNMLTFGL
jgi:hypothetical protein